MVQIQIHEWHSANLSSLPVCVLRERSKMSGIEKHPCVPCGHDTPHWISQVSGLAACCIQKLHPQWQQWHSRTCLPLVINSIAHAAITPWHHCCLDFRIQSGPGRGMHEPRRPQALSKTYWPHFYLGAPSQWGKFQPRA